MGVGRWLPYAPVTISGGSGEFAAGRLGATVFRVGDFDGDVLDDVATSATFRANGGAVVLFRGRSTWPATLTAGAADLTAGPSIRTTTLGLVGDTFGRSLASIFAPTQVRPSLLLVGGTSADLLVACAAHEGGTTRSSSDLSVTRDAP